MSGRFAVATIEIIPVKMPLTEPFVISYATYPDVLSVLVRVRTAEGLEGWGEGTPDPNVTGETWESTAAVLRHHLAPALIGHDARDREAALHLLDSRVEGVPTAKAALEIALFDLLGRAAGLPVYALLGGRSKPHLTISRVVSIKAPEAMAADAARHVSDDFKTVKVKVGSADWRLDVERIRAVRNAIGPSIGLKVDVNQGWRTAGTAIAAITAAREANPDYVEQPIAWWDLEGLADVRRQTGVTIMIDEGCHSPRGMQRAVQLRAADLVNIKIMKTGGLHRALQLSAIAEAAGIPAQVGTMVESSIASAAGLHLATALANVRTVEMGGPLMLAADLGNVRDWYDRDRIAVPDLPGLGIAVNEDDVHRFSTDWWEVSE
jgi:L-alanine-DL-glutamate epimerase-like enolase superfamily enzyme